MKLFNHTFKAALEQFHGTQRFYRLPICGTLYTDGVQYLASEGKAYWLLTDVSIVAKSLMAKSRFITADFRKLSGQEKEQLGYAAVITYSDGNGVQFFSQYYHQTDFPLDAIRLFFVDNTLLLPSEY